MPGDDGRPMREVYQFVTAIYGATSNLAGDIKDKGGASAPLLSARGAPWGGGFESSRQLGYGIKSMKPSCVCKLSVS